MTKPIFRLLMFFSLLSVLGLVPRLLGQPPQQPEVDSVTSLQPTSTGNGFRQYEGKFVTLITDLPHSAALGQLAIMFDTAMPLWGEYFGIEERTWSTWKCTAHLIADRSRFQEAGYIPPQVPPFVHGYQLEDQLWCMDQPSDYYRRHLLLHEGTHWFMTRGLGNPGPPWYMEGMAEKLATHRWIDNKLELDVFPDKREGFEYWGRLLLIKQQRGKQEAPTLEGVLRYGSSAHQQVEAYAWSWAAIWFLKNHPRSAEAMTKLQTAKIGDIASLTPKLLSQLRPHWNELSMSWNAWIQQLDYGCDVNRDIPLIEGDSKVADANSCKLQLKVDRGWQDTGLRVKRGDRITIDAAGRYQIGSDPEPWWCEPEGITIEYFGGQPLGRVVGLVVAADGNRGQESPGKTEFIAVGPKVEWTTQQTGALLLKVNEPPQRLGDNAGTVDISIKLQRGAN